MVRAFRAARPGIEKWLASTGVPVQLEFAA